MSRFAEIYAKERWGRGKGSGDGSDPKYCEDYIWYVQELIDSGNYRSVLDIGCGDGQVHEAIDWRDLEYLGIDLVPSVIQANGRFVTPTRDFHVLDCTRSGVINEIYGARAWDFVLVKDVMQHWSDQEIAVFVSQMEKLSWKTLVVVNDWRFTRDPTKNGQPRDISNPYSWAALPCDHPTLAPLGLTPVGYYPRNRRKQISRRDR